MAKRYEVCARVGEYTDRDGNTKSRWQQCGAVFEKDGRFSLKLDSLPVGNEWNGFFSLFEPRRNDRQEQSAPKANFNDDIPW
jgi:hypothetical protein